MMHLLSDKVLEHFRCCKCSSVLSRGPIYSGNTRTPVCGRCVPNPRDVPNKALEAFLRKCMFPCRYRENGCEEIVPFNDINHEEQCRFKDAIESQFEKIDKSVWQDWKCCTCNNFLTVGPLSLNPEGNTICGRCLGRWSEVYIKETLIRNWKLEYIMKQMWLPCIYHDMGCERALKWDELEEHEQFCPHKPYRCPVTPYEACKSVVPARDLYTHFEKEHSAFILTSPKFKQNLGQDCDTHRIVRVGNHLMVLMSRIRVHKNRMWFSAAFVGDANMVSKMKYVLKISNPEETLHIPFRSETMQWDTILRINEHSAIPITLDGLRSYFRQSNLQEIICNVAVEDIVEVEQNLKLLKHSKRSDCGVFDSELSAKRHKTDTCPEGTLTCKCGLCDLINIAQHENICEEELILCKIKNCKRLYPRSEIKIHESNCEFRTVSCEFPNCGKEYQFWEMEQHKSECEERTRSCRYEDCDAKCSVWNWNIHVRNCKHSFTKEWFCGVCYNLECYDLFLPPLLTQHLLAEHPNVICEGPHWGRTIKKEKKDRIYFQYDGLLFEGCCKSTTDERVKFYLWLLAEDGLASEYKYIFKLIHPTNFQKTIMIEYEINKWGVMTTDLVKPFVKDNSIAIEWLIIKK